MKKHFILLTALLHLGIIPLTGQNPSEVIVAEYNQILVMDTVGYSEAATTGILYIDIAKKSSVYHWDRTNKKFTRELQRREDGTVVSVFKNGGKGLDSIGRVIYKEQNSNILTIRDITSQEWYIMTDTVSFNWTILDSTKVYNDMTLQKAECDFRGRHYTAWFNPTIPYSGGPWKFKGLPGLIIEIYDEKKHVMFNFLSLKQITTDNNAVKPPTDGQAINIVLFREKRKESLKATEKKILAQIKQSGMTVSNLAMRRNDIERFMTH